MRVSYSALETYKNCPLKFKHQELDKIKAPKSIEAVFGSIVHSTLKRMFERTPLYPSLDEIIDFFNNKWQELKNTQNEEILKAYYNDGVEILKSFYKKNSPWNFNALELESRFETVIENQEKNEHHVLAGKIDRIDKLTEDAHYEIIDYKTAKKMPSKEAIDKDLQLSIYGLGLLKRWPHLKPENIKLSLYYLRHNEKIETKRTLKDLDRTKEEILKTINEIQELLAGNKEFIPTPSSLCEWCGYKKACPMWKHLYDKSQNLNLKTQNELEAAVNEYFELKTQNSQNNRRISEITGQISDFMAKEGVTRVFSENGYFTRILQERTGYNMAKIKDILQELNRWEEVVQKKQFSILKATKKKIKKAEA